MSTPRGTSAAVRIVGGTARGRRLKAPSGEGTRPTADRVRQAIFDILGQRFAGGHVLDLYAGSGALALEALSRGCDRATLVEQDRGAAGICADNAASLGYTDRAEVVRADVLASLPRLRGPFSLVFLDPPYAVGPEPALAALREDQLTEDAVVVAEHDKRRPPPDRTGVLTRTDARAFGDTGVSFFARLPPEPA